ncbi:ATP-grasp domain-containing protein [Morganella morganii]|uniref:ATP-grasp domain-containing protein n=1 Tax=Morganella morganii TaxID=582 RepID=UPI0030FF3635
MQIIYPGYYTGNYLPDDTFAEEYRCAQQQGVSCLLLDQEAVSDGKYRFSGNISADSPVIWRGWMLTGKEYRHLHHAVTTCGDNMLVSPEEYLQNHHITGWYDFCRHYTAETIFTTEDADFDTLTSQLKWPGYFVKDYVKSLTTSRGSLAANADEIREIIRLIFRYQGQIEGGISLRHYEYYKTDSERRYFVLNGQAFSADDNIPPVVQEIADIITTPFFSVDITENTAGELRLIEIGDGQVSDIKEWDTEKFITLFSGAD